MLRNLKQLLFISVIILPIFVLTFLFILFFIVVVLPNFIFIIVTNLFLQLQHVFHDVLQLVEMLYFLVKKAVLECYLLLEV